MQQKRRKSFSGCLGHISLVVRVVFLFYASNTVRRHPPSRTVQEKKSRRSSSFVSFSCAAPPTNICAWARADWSSQLLRGLSAKDTRRGWKGKEKEEGSHSITNFLFFFSLPCSTVAALSGSLVRRERSKAWRPLFRSNWMHCNAIAPEVTRAIHKNAAAYKACQCQLLLSMRCAGGRKHSIAEVPQPLRRMQIYRSHSVTLSWFASSSPNNTGMAFPSIILHFGRRLRRANAAVLRFLLVLWVSSTLREVEELPVRAHRKYSGIAPFWFVSRASSGAASKILKFLLRCSSSSRIEATLPHR